MGDPRNYIPAPISTMNIAIPAELLILQERLAEQAHEIWAYHRFNEGWRHGFTRDEAAKTHPCLVPYAELPESEKDYDRRVVAETLRMIIKLGYVITGKP